MLTEVTITVLVRKGDARWNLERAGESEVVVMGDKDTLEMGCLPWSEICSGVVGIALFRSHGDEPEEPKEDGT